MSDTSFGSDEGAAVKRWRRGQAAAQRRQRELTYLEGCSPSRAIAGALAAQDALEEMGLWPGPRDPASEREIAQVRRRWARIQQRARCERQRAKREPQG